MNRKRPITAFGWEIKRKLAELQIDQVEFCRQHGILKQRLSDLITGKRPAKRERKIIERVLGITGFPDRKAE